MSPWPFENNRKGTAQFGCLFFIWVVVAIFSLIKYFITGK